MLSNLSDKVISNEEINEAKLKKAREIILQLQDEMSDYIKNGSGPFLAAIVDEKGKVISKTANSVVSECCSNNHAEMNAIRMAQKKLETYDNLDTTFQNLWNTVKAVLREKYTAIQAYHKK